VRRTRSVLVALLVALLAACGGGGSGGSGSGSPSGSAPSATESPSTSPSATGTPVTALVYLVRGEKVGVDGVTVTPVDGAVARAAMEALPVSYTHLTLPTN
jgi:hypothetical protein